VKIVLAHFRAGFKLARLLKKDPAREKDADYLKRAHGYIDQAFGKVDSGWREMLHDFVSAAEKSEAAETKADAETTEAK
jgi:hypothetical protein